VILARQAGSLDATHGAGRLREQLFLSYTPAARPVTAGMPIPLRSSPFDLRTLLLLSGVLIRRPEFR